MEHSQKATQSSRNIGSAPAQVPLQPSNKYTSSNGRPLGYASSRPSPSGQAPTQLTQLNHIPEEEQRAEGLRSHHIPDNPYFRVRDASPARGDRSTTFPSPVLHHNTVDSGGHPKVTEENLNQQGGNKYKGLSSREAKRYDKYSPQFAPKVNPFILEKNRPFSEDTNVSQFMAPIAPKGRGVRIAREKEDEARLPRLDEGEIGILKETYASGMPQRPLPTIRPRASAPDLHGSRYPSMGEKRSFKSSGLRNFQSNSYKEAEDSYPPNIQQGGPQDFEHVHERMQIGPQKPHNFTFSPPGPPPTGPLPPLPPFIRRPSHNININLPDSPKKSNLQTPYPPIGGPNSLFPEPLQIKKEPEQDQPTPRYGDEEMEAERMRMGWRPTILKKAKSVERPSLRQQFNEPTEPAKFIPSAPVELAAELVPAPVLRKKKSFWAGMFGKDKEASNNKGAQENEKGGKERGRARERVKSEQEEFDELRRDLIDSSLRERKKATNKAKEPRYIPLKVEGCDKYGTFRGMK